MIYGIRTHNAFDASPKVMNKIMHLVALHNHCMNAEEAFSLSLGNLKEAYPGNKALQKAFEEGTYRDVRQWSSIFADFNTDPNLYIDELGAKSTALKVKERKNLAAMSIRQFLEPFFEFVKFYECLSLFFSYAKKNKHEKTSF